MTTMNNPLRRNTVSSSKLPPVPDNGQFKNNPLAPPAPPRAPPPPLSGPPAAPSAPPPPVFAPPPAFRDDDDDPLSYLLSPPPAPPVPTLPPDAVAADLVSMPPPPPVPSRQVSRSHDEAVVNMVDVYGSRDETPPIPEFGPRDSEIYLNMPAPSVPKQPPMEAIIEGELLSPMPPAVPYYEEAVNMVVPPIPSLPPKTPDVYETESSTRGPPLPPPVPPAFDDETVIGGEMPVPPPLPEFEARDSMFAMPTPPPPPLPVSVPATHSELDDENDSHHDEQLVSELPPTVPSIPTLARAHAVTKMLESWSQ
jgi:hypothetical protein